MIWLFTMFTGPHYYYQLLLLKDFNVFVDQSALYGLLWELLLLELEVCSRGISYLIQLTHHSLSTLSESITFATGFLNVNQYKLTKC